MRVFAMRIPIRLGDHIHTISRVESIEVEDVRQLARLEELFPHVEEAHHSRIMSVHFEVFATDFKVECSKWGGALRDQRI